VLWRLWEETVVRDREGGGGREQGNAKGGNRIPNIFPFSLSYTNAARQARREESREKKEKA
jgi:hypothetical protein